MTPPLGLLILYTIHEPTGFQSFLFRFMTDTLADELRVFVTLVLVTLLFNELLTESSRFDIVESRKIIKTVRVLTMVILGALLLLSIVEIVFSALMQYNKVVLLIPNDNYALMHTVISWINGVSWTLCFIVYLICSCLILHFSMKKFHPENRVDQKCLLRLYALNIVSDVACLVIALFSWVLQNNNDLNDTFYIFFDVSAVINIGFLAFFFLLIGPLNKQIETIPIVINDGHIQLQEEQ